MITVRQCALFAACFLGINVQAAASINVSFNESAPKDWFEFTNASQCDINTIKVVINLNGSAGKLIFDTTEKGQGVEVFQPFEVREGQITLSGANTVDDGDQSLAITIDKFNAGQSASFTIDVDDTLKNSELGMIRVSDAEIFGGEVTLETMDGQISKAKFDSEGKVVLPSPVCN